MSVSTAGCSAHDNVRGPPRGSQNGQSKKPGVPRGHCHRHRDQVARRDDQVAAPRVRIVPCKPVPPPNKTKQNESKNEAHSHGGCSHQSGEKSRQCRDSTAPQPSRRQPPEVTGRSMSTTTASGLESKGRASPYCDSSMQVQTEVEPLITVWSSSS